MHGDERKNLGVAGTSSLQWVSFRNSGYSRRNSCTISSIYRTRYAKPREAKLAESWGNQSMNPCLGNNAIQTAPSILGKKAFQTGRNVR